MLGPLIDIDYIPFFLGTDIVARSEHGLILLAALVIVVVLLVLSRRKRA